MLVLAYGLCQYRHRHASTSTVINAWCPFQYCYFAANNASTSTGILEMPIPVLAFLSIVPIPVWAFHICQYWYCYFLNAYTGTGFLFPTMPIPVQAFWKCPYRYWHFCQLCQYQYGHFTYANTGIGIFLMPIPVLASSM